MNYPTIAVIIPTLNEERYLPKCVDSLLCQTYKGSIEILIIDGGSTDNTQSIAEQYVEKYSNIRLLKNPQKFQAYARNIGIQNTNCSLFAYIDAHSFAAPEWIEQLFDMFTKMQANNSKTVGVGSVHLDANNTEFTKATRAAFNSTLGGKNISSYSNIHSAREVPTAYACLYDKGIINLVGNYNTSFIKGEDLELNLRLTRKQDYKLYLNPQAITYYYSRETPAELWRQMVDYGYWRIKVMRHLKMWSIAPMLPALWIVMLGVLFVASFAHYLFFLVFVVVLFCYFGIILASAAFSSIRFKCNYSFLLLAFYCIHFGYGWGVLKALFFNSKKSRS